MKKYTLDLSQEQVNYLERLALDVDTRLSVIDRLFTNHKDDVDASLFESIPFKTYSKELEDAQAKYNLAKDKMSEYLIPLVEEIEGVKDITFDWNISDFSALKVEITVK